MFFFLAQDCPVPISPEHKQGMSEQNPILKNPTISAPHLQRLTTKMSTSSHMTSRATPTLKKVSGRTSILIFRGLLHSLTPRGGCINIRHHRNDLLQFRGDTPVHEAEHSTSSQQIVVRKCELPHGI
jgi:hypothetical protein